MHDTRKPLAVIAGASGNLGSRVLAGFLGDGYRSVALAHSLPDDPTPESSWYEVDATSESSVIQTFERIREEHGAPSVVVQTVGMWAMNPILEISAKEWEGMMAVNLTSTFLVFREALRAMGSHSGRLIGIASGQGADRGAAKQAPYSASKGGLVRLVESIAAEYAGSGITAHAIAPSVITYDDTSGDGVHVDRLVSLCLYLAGDEGDALNGSTIRAYG